MSSRKKKILILVWLLYLILGVILLHIYGNFVYVCYHVGALLEGVFNIILYHDKYKDF